MTAHSREPCVHSMVGHPIERAVVPNSQEHTDATSKFTIQLIPSEFTAQCQILTNYIYTLWISCTIGSTVTPLHLPIKLTYTCLPTDFRDRHMHAKLFQWSTSWNSPMPTTWLIRPQSRQLLWDPTMHKISYTKSKTCTTHIIILFSVHQVIQSIYNKVHFHSSAASLSVLDHPAPQFHGKIQSCYPPVCYIQLVPP